MMNKFEVVKLDHNGREDEFYRLGLPEPTQNLALAGLKAFQEEIKHKVPTLNQAK
jgi:hypothetical protein